MRVLKVVHSGVVSAWRERERALRRRGLDIVCLCAEVWDEGGARVPFEAGGDHFARSAATVGRRPNAFVYDPMALWRLLGEHWDLIDIHEEPCSLATAEICSLLRLRRRRPPFVLYSAQNILKRYPPPFRWTEGWALRSAAGVSVCNAAAGRILVGKGLRGHVAEIPLGVDLEQFSPSQRRAPAGALRIGYVGRLAAHKGVSHLISSVARRPSWTVDLLGGGPDEAALQLQARQLGIQSRVRFLAHAPQTELPARYRSFDAVVVPSLATPRWEEQFCRVAVEAMASGVPVVASHTGALPEVVGDAGILVDPEDADAIRAALDRLVTEPDCWQTLRAAGLARAPRFSWDAVADAYLELYQRALAR